MRNVLTSFLLFIAMIITIVFSISYLNNICKNLQSINTQIEKSIENNSWDEAYDSSLNFLNKWDNYSHNISIFVNHAELDNINIELWKLTQYVKCHDKEEALASNHVLKFLLKHIVNMEKVNLENIF